MFDSVVKASTIKLSELSVGIRGGLMRLHSGSLIALIVALSVPLLSGCVNGGAEVPSDDVAGGLAISSTGSDQQADASISVEAESLVAHDLSGSGFVVLLSNLGHQDEREWRLVSEDKVSIFLDDTRKESSESREYTYDDGGHLISCVEYSDGEVSREDAWEYRGNVIARSTAAYDGSSYIARVVTERDDHGGSVETSYDASGAVTQIVTETRDEGQDGSTLVSVRADASGVTSYTSVREYDGNGHLTANRGYDGEQAEGTLEHEYLYFHDDLGRQIDSYSTYYGSTYGTSSSESHTIYAQDGTSATMRATEVGGYFAETSEFTVSNPKGLVTRYTRNLSADRASSVPPLSRYATYDEDGNPTSVVTEQGSSLIGKRTFFYDEAGRLIWSAEAEYENGSPESVTYHLFEYENASTGERTATPSTDEIGIPELAESDALIALNREGDGPLDQLIYGTGEWRFDLKEDQFGARECVISYLSLGTGQSLIAVGVVHEGGMAFEDESAGLYETLDTGETLFVSYSGIRLCISDVNDDSAHMRGTLADGTEVDATGRWVSIA